MKKPISLRFNGMSQRQAEAIAGNTVGHIVEEFRQAAAAAAEVAALEYMQDTVEQWQSHMGGLYDDDGETRSPLGFLDNIPFSGGFDCYGHGFKSFRI